MGLSFNVGSTHNGNTARSLWRDKKCLPNFGVKLYGDYKYNKLVGKYLVGFTLYLMEGF